MTEPHVEVNGREYVTKDWHGLMAILDDIYPVSTFGVSFTALDAGPRILAHIRAIAGIRQEADA